MQLLLALPGFSAERKLLLEVAINNAPRIRQIEEASLAHHHYDRDTKLFDSTKSAWCWALHVTTETRKDKVYDDDNAESVTDMLNGLKSGKAGTKNKLSKAVALTAG